jgi:hypothetical protein
MAKNKNSNVEPLPAPKAEGSSPQKELSNAEIERRIAAMEKSASDLNNRIFDSHKWFVTVLFSAVAVLLGVYGVLSRLEVRDSIREMEKSVDKALNESKSKTDEALNETRRATAVMELKVGEVLEKASKKPLLQILTTNGGLDGQVLEAPMTGQIHVGPLFVRNIGEKRTDPVSIRLFCSDNVLSQGWYSLPSIEREFPNCYYAGLSQASIAPGETWAVEEALSFVLANSSKTNGFCKLLIFYGAEKPAEAKFQIRTKK